MAAYISTSDGESYGRMRQDIIDMIMETTTLTDEELARDTAQVILFSLALAGSIEALRTTSEEDPLTMRALEIAERYGAQVSYGR